MTEVRRRPHPTSSRLRVALLAVAAVVLVALVATTVVVLAGGDPTRDRDGRGATVCSSMTLPVRYLVDPGTRNARFTTTPEQAAATAATGFTQDEGILFRVATRPADGLVAVHQLQKGSGDQLWSVNASEVRDAVAALGYTDQGVVAYVATSASPCTVQVQRYQSRGAHRYATTARQRDALRAAGWNLEGSFYAAPPGPGASTPSPAGTAVSPAGTTPASPSRSAPASASPSGPGTVIDAGFDEEEAGPVSPKSFIDAVGATNKEDAAYDSMSYVRQDDGQGYLVRTHLAAHRILARNDAPGDGNVLVVPLRDQHEDHACVSYDVRFSPGFEISAGGKLPGLLGVAPGVDPGTPTGGGSTDRGWSGRVMWLGPSLSKAVRESGQPDLAVTYLYHPGQTGTFGDDLGWGRGLVDGGWHAVRQCYTMNTVGASDGVLQAWVDGLQVLDRSDIVYRTDPKVHVTHLDWSVFRGGDTDEWAASTAGDVDLDNLQVTVG